MASNEVGVSTPSEGVSIDECDAPTNPEMDMEALEAIKGDICKWLSNTMQLELTPRTMIEELSNGVVLCKLAALIQQTAEQYEQDGNKLHVNIPMQPVSCNDKAEAGSFVARDNASNFIEWCRKLGVEEAVIFESEGLVLHKDEKRVILCLLDVARFADKVGISPPQLVKMEREIEQLDSGEVLSTNDHTLPEEVQRTYEQQQSAVMDKKVLYLKVLDKLKKCTCTMHQIKVKDCGNGKFVVQGGRIRSQKTLYARILRDCIMVRVGGGWDSLDHFLLVHDPCRIERFISIKSSPNDGIIQAYLKEK